MRVSIPTYLFTSHSNVISTHTSIQKRTFPELLMNRLVVSRNKGERVLIESSINSIRISLKIKQSDDIENILCKKFARFLTQRAESFFIMRRKAIEVIFFYFFC